MWAISGGLGADNPGDVPTSHGPGRLSRCNNIDVQIRYAGVADADFLTTMLVEACNWNGEKRITRRQVEAEPELMRYVAGWPALHDFGVVAVDDDLAPTGAAWARMFDVEEPGYGFVAADVPEISMAVDEAWRGNGIGRHLLVALVGQAQTAGWRRLSLSVEDGNRAVELYREFGFVASGRRGGSNVMVLNLRTT